MSASTRQAPSINRSSSISKPNAGGGDPTQPKMTLSGRPAEGVQKQAGAGDPVQRKPSQKSAWGHGSPNPITGRTNNAPNGTGPPAKPTSKPAAAAVRDGNASEKQANDRLMFLFANLVGQACIVLLKSGERYSGVFSAATLDTSESRIVLKMTRPLPPYTNQNSNGVADAGGDFVGHGPDHIMLFDVHTVVSCSARGIQFDKQLARVSNGAASNFRTDTDISGNVSKGERILQKWEAPEDTNVDLSLESGGSIGTWDQFGDNERKFGLKTDYDETFYTTALPTANPNYKQWEARARQTAKEIEGKTTTNAHIAEERGQLDDSGLDEESKYSGVTRGQFPPLSVGAPNKYTPPARRPPTGQPTVPGAPVDEAIISATLATGSSSGASRAPQPTTAAIRPSTVEQEAISIADAANSSVPVSTADVTSGSRSGGQQSQPEDRASAQSEQSSQAAQQAQAANKDNGVAATVEKDVVTAFKNFSATEKMRVVEHQRKIARHDKAVKLNDLKKFAENFKLHTPVPQDLIPILAKDKLKQNEIVQKNISNIADVKTSPPRQPPQAGSGQSSEKGPKATTPRAESGATPPLPASDRQQRSRQSQGNFSQPIRGERPFPGQPPAPVSVRQGPGHLSQRLNINQQAQRGGSVNIGHGFPPGGMQDPRAPPTGPSATSSGLTSPTANSRFNVKAMEFRPNPAANTFLPSHSPSNGSSPARDQSRRQSVRKPLQGNIFEGRRAIIKKEERIILSQLFNPIQRMQQEVAHEGKSKDYTLNQGIPQAYRTPPTWDVPEANREKTYQQQFEALAMPPSAGPPHHPITVQQPPPHHQQIGSHGQHGRPLSQIPATQLPMRHAGPYGGPAMHNHHDDQQMRFSHSSSGVHPSPRMPQFAYSNQVPQPVMYAGGAAPYGMTPNGLPMNVRQVSSGGPHYMPQQNHNMGGHMMQSQHSNGPYAHAQMNSQGQVYPMPGQVYPHHAAQLSQQSGPNGYASPRPMAAMMSHQGSQQGHGPPHMAYMQPGPHMQAYPQGPQGPMTPMRGGYPQQYAMPYNASPHQTPSYPSQRGTPSGSYAQPMMVTHAMPPQPMVQGGPGPNIEDNK